MVLTATDLKFFYSGGASVSDQNGVQGGTISSVQVTEQVLTTTPKIKQTLFNNVASTQRISGIDQYRCLYLKNTHGTQTASNVKVYIDANTPAPDDVSLGYSGNAVNVPEQTLSSSFQNLYTLATSGSSVSLLSDTRKAQGVYVTDSTHPVLSKPVTKWDVYLSRTDASLTGLMTAGCWHRPTDNVSTGTPKFTLGGTGLDVTTIPVGSFQKFSFLNSSNTVSMVVGDTLMLKYAGGTSSAQIQIARVSNSPKAGIEIAGWDGGNWISVSNWDMAGDIWASGQGGDTTPPTGVTFSNPSSINDAISLPNLAPGNYVGLWYKRHIPANCASMTEDSFEISVAFTSPTP